MHERHGILLSATVLMTVAACGVAGCAGPGPRLFPPYALEVQPTPDGGALYWYDSRGHGRRDYCERMSPQGRIVAIAYDPSGNARLEDEIVLDQVPPVECRHLLLLLDSTPYEMVEEHWLEGRFRFFHRPARTISPFPGMTDLSFAEFFGCSPSPGVEAEYYDGKRLTNGYFTYAGGGEFGWERFTDYHLNPFWHAEAYLHPYPWMDHEFRAIERRYLRHPRASTIGYSVGTSAVGASKARNGHQIALNHVDRLCHYLMFKTRGRARISMLSDHGHEFFTSRRIPLRDLLARLGYRPRDTLDRPGDVIVPEFGMVSCAAIYTREPRDVARDVLGIEGVGLSMYLEDDAVVVLSRDGRARITHSPAGYRYAAEYGDPLALNPILEQLRGQGRVDADGFVDDRVWFEATVTAKYPDAPHRVWRAFHGLVEHTPDVLLDIDHGYHCGSAMMSSLITLTGVHGSLRQVSSSGFAMTMAGDLPPVLRQEDLRATLQGLGVPIRGADTEGQR